MWLMGLTVLGDVVIRFEWVCGVWERAGVFLGHVRDGMRGGERGVMRAGSVAW